MSIPKPKVFWPYTITASNRVVYFRSGVTDYSGNIATGTYYSAFELLTAWLAAMNGALAGFTGSVSTSGVMTISHATPFLFQWGTYGTNGAHIWAGYEGIDSASATSQVASYQIINGWWSDVAVKFDSKDRFEQPNSIVTIAVGGQNKNIDENELTRRDVEFHFLTYEKTWAAASAGLHARKAVENWWREGKARFRYWEDIADEATYGDYFLDLDSVEDGFGIERQYQSKRVYETSKIKMRKYQA